MSKAEHVEHRVDGDDHSFGVDALPPSLPLKLFACCSSTPSDAGCTLHGVLQYNPHLLPVILVDYSCTWYVLQLYVRTINSK